MTEGPSEPGRSREEMLTALAAEKTPASRSAFLDLECAGDTELRRSVEERLSALDLSSRGTGPVAAALRDVSLESPGAFIGKYKLLERLGDGGFGVVWAAEQKEPVKRRVALKIIKLGMDTEQVVARFEAERQALAMMDHPNIAKVLDAGATQYGRPYFVMELVKGVTITRYCEQEKLPVEARLALFIKTCHAIQHAHQKGIIHRDIKPSNILVTLHDGVPVPKVIDFGIAKATQAELTEKTIYTQYGQFIGTPAYMSPEQAEMSGLDIDTRSDIYSLGVLLYEMLTGSTPFDTEELLASGLDGMRKIIREREPLRPSTRLRRTGSAPSGPGATHPPRHSGLATDLDCIVMKCLEKDRTRRYETANALAMDIVRHLNDEPVTARPPSALYKFQKAWRRNKVAYTACAAVIVALAVGVIGLSIGIHRAGIEQGKATDAARSALIAAGEAEAARSLAETNARKLETALYFNRIALAHRELTAQPANVKHSEALLAECLPEALRGWEWRYLKRRRYVDPLVIDDPGSSHARSVAFSSDGRFLAWGSADGKVRIWSLPDGRMARALPIHTSAVVAVAFSPTNPRWIATAGAEGTARLWDWQSPRELHSWTARTSTRDFGTAYAVAFSPDGKLLATPGNAGEFRGRLTETGGDALVLGGQERGAFSTAFSPDGRWVATGSAGGVVRLWEAGTGQEASITSDPAPPIGSLAFTRDSRKLVSLDFGGVVRVRDVETRRETISYSVRMLGASPSVGLAVHPDGERIATGGFDRLVTLSELDTGRQVLVLRELDGNCHCVAFSPDGNQLAAGSASGKVYLWDATPLTGTEDPCTATYRHESSEVSTLDIAPHRLMVAAAGNRVQSPAGAGASLLIWQGSEERAPLHLPGHAVMVFSIAFDPAGRLLAASGDEPRRPGRTDIKVWDLESRREALEVEAFEGEGRLFALAFSRDGKRLVAGGSDRKVLVWDAGSGRKVGVLGEHAGEIVALSFSENGKYLASSGFDKVVRVWDGARLDEMQPAPRRFPGLAAAFADVIAFSPDELRLAVVEDDDTVVLHDLQGTDRAVALKNELHAPVSLAFHPSGRWVITGGKDCTLRVWDAESGALRRTLKSHTDHIGRLRSARFASGSWLVSGSRDGTVKLWDLDAIERKLDSR